MNEREQDIMDQVVEGIRSNLPALLEEAQERRNKILPIHPMIERLSLSFSTRCNQRRALLKFPDFEFAKWVRVESSTKLKTKEDVRQEMENLKRALLYINLALRFSKDELIQREIMRLGRDDIVACGGFPDELVEPLVRT